MAIPMMETAVAQYVPLRQDSNALWVTPLQHLNVMISEQMALCTLLALGMVSEMTETVIQVMGAPLHAKWSLNGSVRVEAPLPLTHVLNATSKTARLAKILTIRNVKSEKKASE